LNGAHKHTVLLDQRLGLLLNSREEFPSTGLRPADTAKQEALAGSYSIRNCRGND